MRQGSTVAPMSERARPRATGKPARGILRQPPGVEHQRVLPSQALAPLIEHHWWVRWSVPEPQVTETLAHPTLHIAFEGQSQQRSRDPLRKLRGSRPPQSQRAVRAELFGITTGRFSKELRGSGFAFGVKFRPAAHAALLEVDSRALTDRVTPLSQLFGRAALRLRDAIVNAPDLAARVELAETFLLARTHALPEEAARFRDLVERIAVDRTIVRVEDAAALVSMDVRTLQRRFRQLVGVSPKWVIQRYRMHEAAEALKLPKPPPLAELAVRLGYYDQAHFSREFKAVVGAPPRVFAAAVRANPA